MTISWVPVIVVDICGAAIALVLAVLCARQALRWNREKPQDILARYLLYLTLAIVLFAVSRSFGHIVKQGLLLSGSESVWKLIAPFSGALNTTTFVIIFGLSISFQRFRALHKELQAHRDSLQALVEERTRELATANLALRQSEEHLRSIVDTEPECVKILDLDNCLVAMNPAGLAMIEAESLDMAKGRSVLPIVDEEFRDDFRKLGDKVCKRGESGKLVFRITGLKGTPLWLETHAVPYRDSEGRITGLLAVTRNITESKRAEQEREQLITKLESQNAELERFTYTVSHDLKSPLITINGYLGLLRQDLAAGKSQRVEDDLSRISNAAEKMELLLRDLLELSRIGRLVNPSEEVSLDKLTREAMELVGGQIKERGVEVEISPGLPVVFGDRLRLSEVLQNLIDNAAKYMGDQPQPRIEVGSRRDGNETVCYVRDNGIGIDPRYHEKVFGLFDQLNPSVEGSGIGLSLVKRIVEVHGGRIWVESEGPGHGSTFCFTLAAKCESVEHPG